MTKDLDFEAAVEKGQTVLRMLASEDQPKDGDVAASDLEEQSIFVDPQDLQRHGYVRRRPSRKFPIQNLREVLRDIGADEKMAEDGGKYVAIEHIHEEDQTTIVGEACAATGGHLSQVCNHSGGVLIAHSNLCAPYAGLVHDPPVTDYPSLHHWSDVAYLQWVISDPNPSTLPAEMKYIIRSGIQNAATCMILTKIIQRQNRHVFDIWPGLTFSIDSEEGLAILGTPNGSGTAYLLAQHREQLGYKTIDRVTVFHAGGKTDIYRWPSLLFWLR